MDIEKVLNEYLNYYPEEKNKFTKLFELINHNKNNNSNLFNRKNFEGHITASGYIYCKNQNKILLLEHKSLKKYLQPGGHVEKEDKGIIDTAKREIFEETGLSNLQSISISNNINIPFDINSHYIPANLKKKEKGHYHHDFRFLFITNKLQDINIDKKESNSYKWIDVNNILHDKTNGLAIKKIINIINKIK